MRKEIFGVLLLTLLCGSSNVTGNISGVVKKILSPFFHQHKSEKPVTVTTIEINDDTAEVTQALLEIWDIIRELFEDQVLNVENKIGQKLRFEASFTSFHTNQFHLFKEKFTKQYVEKQNYKEVLKYFIPLLKHLKSYYREKCHAEFANSSTGNLALYEFYSFANEIMSEIVYLFMKKSTDSSVFKVKTIQKELKIITKGNFKVNLTRNDLKIVHDRLVTIKNKHLETLKSLRTSTGATNCQVGTQTEAHAFLNVWTSIRDLIYSQVQLIQRSGASLLECQKDFLSFYKEQYATFSQYLDALPISASSPRDRAKYLLPLLSQLQILYRQESLTTEQVTTTTTTTTSSTQSSLRTFSSYAYQSISQVLSVFQSKCSDQSIFSSSESVIDLATVSQSGFSVNVAASDLTSVYEILELLRERQSLVLKNYSSLTIVRSDIAEKFDWKIRTKINSLFELYNRGVQSLIAHTPLEDLNKVGVSITTLLQKLISYHDNFLLFDLDGLKLGSVDYMRSRLVLDQKIQAILLQLLNDFIEWKDDVVALKTGSGVLSTCVMKCHPEILLN